MIGEKRIAAIAKAAQEELARRSLVEFGRVMYPDFSDARHVRLIASLLEDVEAGHLRRLLVNLPPRHGKSLLCSSLFPAWYVGRHPHAHVIIATYSQELSDKNSRTARAFLEDELWPFATRLSQESSSVSRWNTTDGGGLFAIGVEGGVTGRGADLLILDDVLHDAGNDGEREAAWRWFTEVAIPRLEPGAAIVAIGTRFHEDDLFGRLLSAPDASGWRVIRLPAITAEDEDDALGRKPGEALWPERITPADLENRRLSMGSRAFESQFQQRPLPAQGALIRAQWLGSRYQHPPEFEKIVSALDAAAKTGVSNDFSVIVTIGVTATEFFVLEVVRRRVEYPELLRMAVEVFEKHHPSALYVEDTSNAIALVQELRRTCSLPVVPVKPAGSKIARVEAITGTLEAGRLRLPADSGWLLEFERELLAFPNGRHDDQVDALALALGQVQRRKFAFAAAIGDEDEYWAPVDTRHHQVLRDLQTAHWNEDDRQ